MRHGNVAPPSPNGAEQKARRERKHWLEYAIFFFVVATAAATAVAAWYTRKEWKTANETLILSERAFVQATGFTFKTTKDPDPQLGELLNATIILSNIGNSRTRGLEFLVKCVTSPTKLAEPWGLLHQENAERLPQIIAPKSSVNAPCGFKKADVAAMAGGKLFGYLMGDIGYRTVFDQTLHVTQFSLRILIPEYAETPFSVTVETAAVGRHNCADEDCPSE